MLILGINTNKERSTIIVTKGNIKAPLLMITLIAAVENDFMLLSVSSIDGSACESFVRLDHGIPAHLFDDKTLKMLFMRKLGTFYQLGFDFPKSYTIDREIIYKGKLSEIERFSALTSS